MLRPILVALLAGALLLISCPSCSSPGSAWRGQDSPRRPRIETGSGIAGSDLPPWAGMTSSWDKLDSIESWLDTPAARESGFWRVEGQLQLAEGRMEFAEGASGSSRDARRVASKEGFEQVRDDPQSTTGQRLRAENGLARLGRTWRDAHQTSTPAPTPRASLSNVRSRSAWRARSPRTRDMDLHRGAWRYITIHHSAMEGAAADLGSSEASATAALREIQGAHMNGSGYGDIGYHFLIDPAGRVWQGRDLRWQGAHAGGSNNVGNVGICLLGNFDQTTPTKAALGAMQRLTVELQRSLDIPYRNVRGHSDWKGTRCPGRHLLPHVRDLAR